jgi:acyl carrier protein
VHNTHIYRSLTEIFHEVFDDDSIVLTPETTAADIDGWDSMAHVGLMVAIEARMNIRFKSTELEAMHNVGQLAGVLEYKLESQQAGT